MSNIIKSRAFVLRKLDYGDSSKIVSLFSEELGKISGIVKGAKSPKSKIGAQIDLLNFLNIVIYEKASREVQLITQADTIKYYPSIKGDLEKLKYSSAIIELVLLLIPEHEPNTQLFKAIIRIFDLIESGSDNPSVLFLKFYIYFIKIIGYEIQIDQCPECGKDLVNENGIGFNNELGFLCGTCKSDHLIIQYFDKELFNFLYCLSHRNYETKFNALNIEKIVSFLEKYLSYLIPEYKGLRSLKMF